MTAVEEYDFAVVGAGIFGAYAALHFASLGMRVILIDAEPRPWRKASMVNQARVHFGYHYPRSIATARLANDHRSRFETEHKEFINRRIEKYYGIDRHGSLTSADQFTRFCEYLQIPCRETTRPDLFNQSRFEALFETSEYSFDAFLLRSYYMRRVEESAVEVAFGWRPVAAEADGASWDVTLTGPDGQQRRIRAGNALNATYANINAVNRLFGVDEIDVTHELSEIVILKSPGLDNIGLTVMDGPYMSIMPYGMSSFHSLTSVLYTHHAVSTGANPSFACQSKRVDCVPDFVRTCTSCSVKPQSNLSKMTHQMRLYVKNDVMVQPHGSLFTVKAKLRSSFVDDARPTDVRVARTAPMLAYVFSGKINSIYEVEQLGRVAK